MGKALGVLVIIGVLTFQLYLVISTHLGETQKRPATITSKMLETPGPEINGRKTTLLLHEASDLAASPLLPSFMIMINAAFSFHHPPALPSSWTRLDQPENLPKELGAEAFTYALVYTDDNQDAKAVLATISARPFRWKDPELQDPRYKTFAYWTNPIEADTEVWEIKLMCVDLTVQKHGLATMLLGVTEAEIRRRFAERKLVDSKVGAEGETVDESANRRRLMIVLQTIREMNGKYYEKRGWGFKSQVKREGGWEGSESGFNYATYAKVFDF